MHKQEFVETAPTYYALAVIAFARKHPQPFTETSLMRHYRYGTEDGFDDGPGNYLQKKELLDAALAWLLEQDMLSVVPDKFAPSIYGLSPNFS